MALVSKTYGRILAILLAWLGISCEDQNLRVEYGTPTAIYKAKGTVVSKEDGKPIKGIRAVMMSKIQYRYDSEVIEWGIDTAYTDINGKFNLIGDRITTDNLHLKLEDIDGEENGLYTDQIEELKYNDEKFTGGKGWYDGEAEKDLGTIEMTPKK